MSNLADTYEHLHKCQLSQEEGQTRSSAFAILKIVLEYLSPRSVVDVGCGLGSWLLVAQQQGIQDVRGIEGKWLKPDRLVIDPSLVTLCDLENGFSLGRRFDLAVCLEVGEHLPPKSAEGLVSCLTDHADVVLFSAAIPYQGGTHHVNEQFPDYWALMFQARNYVAVDCVRPRIWNDKSVLWWLRQNTLLFVNSGSLERFPSLAKEAEHPRCLSIVHPELYMMRLNHAQAVMSQSQQVLNLLAQGGTFKVAKGTGGQLLVQRI